MRTGGPFLEQTTVLVPHAGMDRQPVIFEAATHPQRQLLYLYERADCPSVMGFKLSSRCMIVVFVELAYRKLSRQIKGELSVAWVLWTVGGNFTPEVPSASGTCPGCRPY